MLFGDNTAIKCNTAVTRGGKDTNDDILELSLPSCGTISEQLQKQVVSSNFKGGKSLGKVKQDCAAVADESDTRKFFDNGRFRNEQLHN